MTSDRTLNLEALLDLPSPARPLPQSESALTPRAREGAKVTFYSTFR